MRFADIFLPSDGAFDDKISETFHHNAVGERGRRGVFCAEIAAVAIRGIVSMAFPHIQGHGRDNPFPIQAIPICPSVRFLLKRSIFLRILAYKQSATYRSCNGILNGLQHPCTPLTKIPQNGYFPNLTSFFQNQISRYSKNIIREREREKIGL